MFGFWHAGFRHSYFRILDSDLPASERRDSDKKRATGNLPICSHPFPPFLYLSLRHFITAAENNTMRISQVCSHMFEFVRRVMQAASS
jgi:hypothetical protein